MHSPFLAIKIKMKSNKISNSVPLRSRSEPTDLKERKKRTSSSPNTIIKSEEFWIWTHRLLLCVKKDNAVSFGSDHRRVFDQSEIELDLIRFIMMKKYMLKKKISIWNLFTGLDLLVKLWSKTVQYTRKQTHLCRWDRDRAHCYWDQMHVCKYFTCFIGHIMRVYGSIFG